MFVQFVQFGWFLQLVLGDSEEYSTANWIKRFAWSERLNVDFAGEVCNFKFDECLRCSEDSRIQTT